LTCGAAASQQLTCLKGRIFIAVQDCNLRKGTNANAQALKSCLSGRVKRRRGVPQVVDLRL
jgi:hypothetical protein